MAAIQIGSTGVFYEDSTTGAGTGNYDSFLRIQDNTSPEDGFNTDVNGVLDNKDGKWTHSLQISTLQLIDYNSQPYYEFRLDLNEDNKEDPNPIRLDNLDFYVSTSPAGNTLAGLGSPVFSATNISLIDINTGSGTDDYRFLVPASMFPDTSKYLTFYTKFSGNDGGFEEWRALSSAPEAAPGITIDKVAEPVTIGEGGATVQFSYTLTSQSVSTDPLTITMLSDDHGTPELGDDINLLSGIDSTHPLGQYYVSGDSDGDKLLDSSETWLFQYQTTIIRNAGQVYHNTATVKGADNEGVVVTDTDDATVTATDVLPAITLVKTATPDNIVEGGSSSITYIYELTSQSVITDPLSIVTLTDDMGTPDDTTDDKVKADFTYLSGDTANIGKLDPGETWKYQLIVNVGPLDSGAVWTNTAKVTATDDENKTVGSQDTATVTATNADPKINIEKAASVSSIAEGSVSSVKYTYTVTSQSVITDPLTILSLVDDMGTAGAGDDKNLSNGINFIGGDTSADSKLDPGETWVYELTTNVGPLNVGTPLVNTARVDATDDENTPVYDTATATVTATDVAPAIDVEKTASVTSLQAGTPTNVTYTYVLKNVSPAAAVDPLSNVSLKDDMGTPGDLTDDKDLLINGAAQNGAILTYTTGDTDNLLEANEVWTVSYTKSVTLNPGQTLTNIAIASGTDDEGGTVTDKDDASIRALNLCHTPGYWYNNGAPTWDGDDSTMPANNSWANFVFPTGFRDLAIPIKDLNGDGAIDNAGNRNYLMIGDWDNDGIAGSNENVLVISREGAMTVLNSSQKQVQDGRWEIARDVVASWLNVMAGSYEGVITDNKSVMHYIDEAVAFLIKTTNGDHVLDVPSKTIPTTEMTTGAIAKSGASVWQTGYDFDGDGIKGENMLSPTHYYGPGVTPTTGWDIMSGSAIHTGLDFYNNNGYIA